MVQAKLATGTEVVFLPRGKEEGPVSLVKVGPGCVVEVTEPKLVDKEINYASAIRVAMVNDGLLPGKGLGSEMARLRVDLGYIAMGLRHSGEWTHVLFAPSELEKSLTLLAFSLAVKLNSIGGPEKVDVQSGEIRMAYVFGDGGRLVYEYRDCCVAVLRERNHKLVDVRTILIGSPGTTAITPGKDEKFVFITPGFASCLFYFGGMGVEAMQAGMWVTRRVEKVVAR